MSIVLVDKPGGMTSHDVVSRARRAFGTKKVGHAGTLDPMATGLLVLGIGPATRLLTWLVGLGKTYEATVRLGSATTTDDAEGEITVRADAEALAAADDAAIAAGVARLTGRIAQVPSSVSAIKVDGRRAYDRVRAGEAVELAAREVDVTRFAVAATRRGADAVDLDVVVDCSSGTYIRALARDLGRDLGVGGHLTALRRTWVGPFEVADAVAVDDLTDVDLAASGAGAVAAPAGSAAGGDPAAPAGSAAAAASVLSPAAAASAVLGALAVDAAEATALRQGKRLAGAASRLGGDGPAAAIDPDGLLVGVVERRGDDLKSVMNLAEGAT